MNVYQKFKFNEQEFSEDIVNLIKKWFWPLIMKTLYFLFFKKDITRSKQNTILVLMRLDMKISKRLQIYL